MKNNKDKREKILLSKRMTHRYDKIHQSLTHEVKTLESKAQVLFKNKTLLN
jgi:hypothetical protein